VSIAAALATPSVAAADSPGSTVSGYGLNALRVEWLAEFPLGVDDLGRMGQSNIRLYRPRFRQDQVVSGSTYDWTRLDNLTRQAALNGVTLVPTLYNMPGEIYTPPKSKAAIKAFGNFAAAAARRYGSNGSFWGTCGCPKRPINVWEVWNEENITPYWDAPNAVEYAKLLTGVRTPLRRADAGARILIGGLAHPGSTNGTTRIDPSTFLRTVIQTAGPNSFDAVALHDYHSNPATGVNTALAATVNTLKTYAGTGAGGAPRQQVWVNEFGKATARDDPATTTDEELASEPAQRDWMNGFLDALLPHRSDWNLGPVFWYALRDHTETSQTWYRLGLRRTNSDDTDGGAKLAWDAYVSRSSTAADVPLPTLR
jgi:hypothetical protein